VLRRRQDQVDVVHGPQTRLGIPVSECGAFENQRFEAGVGERLHGCGHGVREQHRRLNPPEIGVGSQPTPE
jgi:hypothetical protein